MSTNNFIKSIEVFISLLRFQEHNPQNESHNILTHHTILCPLPPLNAMIHFVTRLLGCNYYRYFSNFVPNFCTPHWVKFFQFCDFHTWDYALQNGTVNSVNLKPSLDLFVFNLYCISFIFLHLFNRCGLFKMCIHYSYFSLQK